MGEPLEAIFDGKVFRPVAQPDLEPNSRWLLHLEKDAEPAGPSLWEKLAGLAGSIEAPPDWAENHDQYLSAKKVARPTK